VQFDKYGNVVGNIYIRKVEKKGAALVNAVIKTYPNVSQFWTYDADEFPEEAGLQSRELAGEQEYRA
jgi:branched-chain amino acid transport system substrate-binding protein